MAFDSLFVGVSGLNAYQNQIDVISNNIANVGTTGFKGQSVNFQDMLYQSQSFASAPTSTNGGVNGQDVGFGVKTGSVDTNFAQGGNNQTNVNTNLMLNGDGFFVMRQPGGSGTPLYTRNGDFSLNENGLLYDHSSGMAVQGYTANANGVILAGGVPGDIILPLGLQQQAIGTGFNSGQKFGPTNDSVYDVSLGGNLDQTQWMAQAQSVQTNGASPVGTPYTTSTTIYDSLGNAHLATITYKPDASGATAGTAAIGANAALAGGGNVIASINGAGASVAGAFTVTINAAVPPIATITGPGGSVSGPAGATVNIDGASVTLGNFAGADSGKTATFTTTAAVSGLPASVSNASGVAENPATRWQVSVSFADGTTFETISNPGAVVGGNVAAATYGQSNAGVVGYAYFDQNGQYINSAQSIGAVGVPPGGALTTAAGDVHLAGKTPGIANGNELNIQTWGTVQTNNSVAPTAPGAAPQTGPIGFDYSNLKSLSGAYTPSTLAQNGRAPGTLQNVTVSQDGTVVGAFSNGQHLALAQVAVATFQNEQGLQRVGSSDFAATSNSGLAQVGIAGTGKAGTITSGALEQSNVSIADEFTKMIAAQNAYQANSKSITVASENMQTVTNLIR